MNNFEITSLPKLSNERDQAIQLLKQLADADSVVSYEAQKAKTREFLKQLTSK